MVILLVEDHQDIAGIIFDYFEIKGHELDYASDGKQGLALASSHYYDLIILDVMLPGIDGLSVCQQLRAQGIDTPVLMLTARDEKQDVLDGFAHGVDDYLVKPFDLHILEARVQALHRRKSGAVAQTVLSFDGLQLDMANRVARRDGQTIRLNQIPFIILKVLMLRAPNIATRDEVVKAIWKDDVPDGDVLRSHIYQLRNLIDKPFAHAYIKTVPKVGYQLVEGPKP